MKKAFFITGTDTGVGKTFVGALLAAGLKKMGIDVGVMKPVETGCPKKGGVLLPKDAMELKKASASVDPLDLINPYRFSVPVAPSIAARLEKRRIDLARIKKCYLELLDRHDVLIVEGAGGLMTPLTDDKTNASLAAYLKTPLIIVAASRLGVINHTLLTISAARSKGIRVKGVILNRADGSSDISQKTNCLEIERLANIPVLADVPFMGNKKAAFFQEGGLLKAVKPVIDSMI